MAGEKQHSDGRPAGQIIGQSSTDLLGFWGTTPIVQPSGAAEAAVTTAVAVTAGANWGFGSSAQANAIVTLVNEIRRVLVAEGLMAGA